MSRWMAVAGLAACGEHGRPAPPDVHRPAPEVPVLTAPLDRDGDGFADDVDCWPRDPERFPGGPEQCNGLDDDCDGELDPIMDQDLDQDGFPWCTDCWDTEPTFFPGADDPYGDGLDQNCDGTDGVGERVLGAVFEGRSDWHAAGWWLASSDVDGDGCDELAMTAPSYPLLPSQADGQVTLASGCTWPDPALTDRVLVGDLFYGDRVEMSGDLLVSLDLYRGGPAAPSCSTPAPSARMPSRCSRCSAP